MLGVPLVCVAWVVLTGDETHLGTVLGVAGITYAQLVLKGQARDAHRDTEMLREVVHAVPEANDAVAEES